MPDEAAEIKSWEASTAENIESAIARGEVSWGLLLEVSSLAGLPGPANAGIREIGRRHFAQALEIYRETFDGEIGLFPPVGGVCVQADGEFRWNFNLDQIWFDWSEVWPLTYQIETLAEEAKEWWPDLEPEDGNALKWWQIGPKIVGFLKQNFVRLEPPAVTRRPHSMRAFNLAAWILAAISQENKRHPAGVASEPPPSPTKTFEKDLALYREELEITRRRFRAAAQRTAQSRYWQGALVGIAALGMICLAVGLVFWWRGADAAYGVALPAGSLGAVVSVLQRMSSGKLVLDIDASREMLEVFGAIRPFIGAIFGLAVSALLVGGLIPAIEISNDQSLAFFAGIGFLAGFNERWAQDVLRSSSNQVSASGSASSPAGSGGA